ncbi:MAG: hypothetical protein LBG58_16250 [Planctomycetaceae bacterium]|jgi:hypothetical protein|nr:hypothetical protein [Planctomycetaceae bacterium]
MMLPIKKEDSFDIDDLFQQYISGEMTEKEGQLLWDQLQKNPKLTESLFQQMELDVMLEEVVGDKTPLEASDKSSEPETIPASSKKRRNLSDFRLNIFLKTRSALLLATVMIIVIVLILNGVILLFQNLQGNTQTAVLTEYSQVTEKVEKVAEPEFPEPEIPELLSTAVAIISGSVDAVWDNRSGVFRQGQSLETCWMRLRSGLVSLTFFNGAEVVMEGPAELEIISISHVLCRFGNINVTVPPQAQGFLVSSPQMVVKDIGTAFAVSVTPRGTEVHVIKGEIELQEVSLGSNNLPANLKEGEALLVTVKGDSRYFQANNDVFAPTRSLKGKTKEYVNLQYEKWKNRRQRFDTDPFLLFHFDFENLQEDAESVANIDPSPKNNLLDGRIVGCRLSEGRWAGKGAVEFSRTSDRIRVYVPESCESITFSTWIRINSLDRRSNALFVTENDIVGEHSLPTLQWSILQSGSLRLELASPIPGEKLCYESPPYFKPEHFGQWIHLAVVVDGLTQTVSYFVDGVLIGTPIVEFPFKESLPIRIGMAEIGNVSAVDQTKKGKPIRNFCGCMDEFHFFSRALSREEIWDLYDPVSDWNDENR